VRRLAQDGGELERFADSRRLQMQVGLLNVAFK
jgi:hypothetical protein